MCANRHPSNWYAIERVDPPPIRPRGERALALGWAQPRVLVIDEDLGKSADQAAGRPGFQRLVAEVSLAHVGIVFGLDISRLSRSSRDWHHLVEVCALFGTLIGDLDGVYDPLEYNDRLLLGLKGTLFEAGGGPDGAAF